MRDGLDEARQQERGQLQILRTDVAAPGLEVRPDEEQRVVIELAQALEAPTRGTCSIKTR